MIQRVQIFHLIDSNQRKVGPVLLKRAAVGMCFWAEMF